MKISIRATLAVAIAIFTICDAARADKRVFRNTNDEAYHARFTRTAEGDCRILVSNWIPRFRGFTGSAKNDQNALVIQKKDRFEPLADSRDLECSSLFKKNNHEIYNIYGRREETVNQHVDLLCASKKMVRAPQKKGTKAEPEITKMIDSGDQSNRIDVVFMGDGYTAEERQEFFDDMRRLTTDMFEGTTFRSYLPLFNIWAIFVESVESGIGYDGPKDTPFQLTRDAGTLRGIFPGNPGYAEEVCAMTGEGGCDYPSLIGNDDFYGGLGGEFVISTRSNRTGTVVLRHEMGHNFIAVGEEYDNGGAYYGVNNARSVESLGWSHWLSGAQREERLTYRLLEYPWYDLSQGSQTFTFTSDGSYSRWYMLVSVSAAGQDDCLEFELDGEVLPWTTSGFDDREFYSWDGNIGFTAGQHTFTVRSKTNSTHPMIPRMICSVNLHEFGSESEFEISNDFVSAYPTFDYNGGKTFRPTNAGCLMRNMTHNALCNVCREGMWYQFFNTISLIDSVTVDNNGNPNDPQAVTLHTLKLAHFRDADNVVAGEELRTTWYYEGNEMTELLNKFEISAQPGSWRVDVKFTTPEVRVDPEGLLEDSATFTV